MLLKNLNIFLNQKILEAWFMPPVGLTSFEL